MGFGARGNPDIAGRAEVFAGYDRGLVTLKQVLLELERILERQFDEADDAAGRLAPGQARFGGYPVLDDLAFVTDYGLGALYQL